MKLYYIFVVMIVMSPYVVRAEYPDAYEEYYQDVVDYVKNELQSSTNETVASTSKLLLQGIEDGILTGEQLREYMRGQEFGFSLNGLAALEWFRTTGYDIKAIEPLIESSDFIELQLGYLCLRFVKPSEEKLQILRNQLAKLVSSKIMSGESTGGFILHEIGSCYASLIAVDNPLREKISLEIRQGTFDNSFHFGILNEMIQVLDYNGTCIDVETSIIIENSLKMSASSTTLDDFLNKLGCDKNTKILSTRVLTDIKEKSEGFIKVATSHMNDRSILKDNESMISRGTVKTH